MLGSNTLMYTLIECCDGYQDGKDLWLGMAIKNLSGVM